ncbi:hypothetical protein P4V86_19250 [Brevibacillus laterosporus]|uniref:hypothetical protein n=1 Tax=Brevibacillus laterosporus TaxID=1465 RepID=UPI00036A7625|nr:hypothetical protein [Brevibacillus laterosporus]MED2005459.1 hypothetical protein [Brevibacillus laterosporus]
MDTTDKYGAGFVVIPRITFEHFIDEVLYNFLMKGANYKASNECQRGQIIVSVRKLPEVMGWTYQQIRTSLDRLSKSHLIKMEQIKYKGNKASLITIVNYDGFQQLENYSKINAPNNAPNNASANAPNNAPNEPENDVVPSVLGDEEDGNNAPNNAGTNAPNSAPNNANRTSVKQQVKHIKESCRSREDITSFVDSQQLLNRIELPNRLFVEYFDLVRLQRKSGKIANSVLEGLWGRLAKQAANAKQSAEANQAIVTYALSTYIMNYGHKPAEYAFGIISNTSEPEARQGMIRLQNSKQEGKNGKGRTRFQSDVSGIAKKGTSNTERFAHLNTNSTPVPKVQGSWGDDVI